MRFGVETYPTYETRPSAAATLKHSSIPPTVSPASPPPAAPLHPFHSWLPLAGLSLALALALAPFAGVSVVNLLGIVMCYDPAGGCQLTVKMKIQRSHP
ncbi:Hypothetical protein NTJ_05283 [Nesidiocoris tenuis]|uniref:Uncharacterized protein n=1 Tax=Nesidiocoris tenuis TaxID=355587 RepID=A0ABN7AMK7_9HEMI|nr:Hypothetical protein NTJ_05283 [Nesidiocoris tenuis]